MSQVNVINVSGWLVKCTFCVVSFTPTGSCSFFSFPSFFLPFSLPLLIFICFDDAPVLGAICRGHCCRFAIDDEIDDEEDDDDEDEDDDNDDDDDDDDGGVEEEEEEDDDNE